MSKSQLKQWVIKSCLQPSAAFGINYGVGKHQSASIKIGDTINAIVSCNKLIQRLIVDLVKIQCCQQINWAHICKVIVKLLRCSLWHIERDHSKIFPVVNHTNNVSAADVGRVRQNSCSTWIGLNPKSRSSAWGAVDNIECAVQIGLIFGHIIQCVRSILRHSKCYQTSDTAVACDSRIVGTAGALHYGSLDPKRIRCIQREVEHVSVTTCQSQCWIGQLIY